MFSVFSFFINENYAVVSISDIELVYRSYFRLEFQLSVVTNMSRDDLRSDVTWEIADRTKYFMLHIFSDGSHCRLLDVHIPRYILEERKLEFRYIFSLSFRCGLRANENEDFRFYSEDCAAEIEQWLLFTHHAHSHVFWLLISPCCHFATHFI